MDESTAINSPSETRVREALATVIDPELGFDLVALGLIYSIGISGPRVTVHMTLTTPGCPMHESLVWGVRRALLALDGVREVDVRLVWDPPWHPTMMSPEVRDRLGVA